MSEAQGAGAGSGPGGPRGLHIVVLDTMSESEAKGIAATIAEALLPDAKPQPVAGLSIPPSPAPASVEDKLLRDADAAIVLDPSSLERAKESGIPFVAAVLPSFDTAWAGDFAEADCVIVAHDALVPDLVRRGVPKSAIEVSGPVPPLGYAAPEDRAAARAQHGPRGKDKVVIVPAVALEEEGVNALLVQLSLVQAPVVWLFDVGQDADAAEALRRFAPAHQIHGYMFADTPEAAPHWQTADVVLARARGEEVSRALGVGTPLVLLPPGRSDAVAVSAMQKSGVATVAESMATLSVTLDAALDDARLKTGRAAVTRLDPRGSAHRVAEIVTRMWKSQRDTGRLLPRGLPVGLEKLPDTPRGSEPPPAGGGSSADDEARIDRELEELKKRL